MAKASPSNLKPAAPNSGDQPQNETPATPPAAPAGKPAKAAKQPKQPSAQEEAAALAAAERAGRASLADAQTVLAKERRLHKAAKKDPAVFDLLEESKAKAAVIEQLREELVAAREETRIAAELLVEAGNAAKEQASKLAAAEAEVTRLKADLAAALKPKAD